MKNESKSREKKSFRPNGKIRVVIMEPIELYRDSIVLLLDGYFKNSIEILGFAKSLSETRCLLLKEDCVDIFIGEPIGMSDNLSDWFLFCSEMRNIYPSLNFFVWTKIPIHLLCAHVPKDKSKILFFGKKTQIKTLCDNISFFIINNSISSPCCSIQLPPKLTKKEVAILVELIRGKSLRQISVIYNNSLKTISSHKCRAMKKLGVKSNVQLILLLKNLGIDRRGISPCCGSLIQDTPKSC
ncbi:LuxR C-terminal-related transcriptional regulator [Serratia sp. MF1(2023)]|nr:LuxR C-terminal-related transcriptional regulator [Serratia sp. MF2]